MLTCITFVTQAHLHRASSLDVSIFDADEMQHIFKWRDAVRIPVGGQQLAEINDQAHADLCCLHGIDYESACCAFICIMPAHLHVVFCLLPSHTGFMWVADDEYAPQN